MSDLVPPRIEVVRQGIGYGLQAMDPVSAGGLVLVIRGHHTARPTRTSLQVDAQVHLDVPEGWGLDRVIAEMPWQFLNHGCDPNVAVQGNRVVALRQILPGDEIVFDYETTEWEMAEPFTCHCGSPSCRGTIRGFRFLDAEARARLAPALAAHLREDATPTPRNQARTGTFG